MVTELNTENIEQTSAVSAHTHTPTDARIHIHTHTHTQLFKYSRQLAQYNLNDELLHVTIPRDTYLITTVVITAQMDTIG